MAQQGDERLAAAMSLSPDTALRRNPAAYPSPSRYRANEGMGIE